MYTVKNLHVSPPIRLPSTCCGDNGAAVIGDILKSTEHQLESLQIVQNFVGTSGATQLAEAIATVEGGRLTSLDLSWNPDMSDDGTITIANALCTENCMLTTLGLAGCNIADTGVTALARSILGIVTPVDVDASDSDTCTSSAATATATTSSSCLTSLSLYANNITSVGATQLGNALKSASCLLERLDLRVNEVGDAGANAILNGTGQTEWSKLAYLDLEKNDLTCECVPSICKSLSSPCSTLTRLHLCNNSIGDEGCRALVHGLTSEHSTLTYIDLNRNKISNKGVFELAKALSIHQNNNTTTSILQKLFLYSNPFADTEEGKTEAAVSMFGSISTTGVQCQLMDLGGIELNRGSTATMLQGLTNRDVLNSIRKKNTTNEEDNEEDNEDDSTNDDT